MGYPGFGPAAVEDCKGTACRARKTGDDPVIYK